METDWVAPVIIVNLCALLVLELSQTQADLSRIPPTGKWQVKQTLKTEPAWSPVHITWTEVVGRKQS
eukprot:513171-Amphidinium_carterae.1